jgi:hypothetical protein
MDNRFRVCVSLETVAARLKLALQVAIVVNLAVENNRNLTVAAGHWLTPARQIDDRQTPHAERNSIVDQDSLIVGPAMSNHATHAVEHGARFARVTMLISANKSGDATHSISSSD